MSFAFTQAGLTLGYISHEIIRRWTQVLGVANFSYHVPGRPSPTALVQRPDRGCRRRAEKSTAGRPRGNGATA